MALGSNVPHHRWGPPGRVLQAALAWLDGDDLQCEGTARIVASPPLGPSIRRYANTVALIATTLEPPELLARLHGIEQAFGRRRRGQPWAARVLDLDIVLWGGGAWSSPGLTVPHVAFRDRAFVLRPALPLAATWRDPLTGLTLRHLHHRLTRPRPIPR